MTDQGFASMGFDFLQDLVRNAGSAIPGVGQWVAPTLDPEVLEKRIAELKTVQFWLDQNSRMIAASIQALEVQRMTLTTLKAMNMSIGDMAEALRADPKPAEPERPAASAPAGDGDAGGEAPKLVDPMQWWGALARQFGEIAQTAIEKNSSAAEAAQTLAQSMVKQSVDAGVALRDAAAATASGVAAKAAAAAEAATAANAEAGGGGGKSERTAKAAGSAKPASKTSSRAGARRGSVRE